jgi:putative selenate reductase
VVLRVKGFAQPQILHMDAMCNECGNCAVFCPYESRPYRDKFTLFACREDFEASTNEGFLPETDGSFTVRLDDQIQKFHPETDAGTLRNDIEALIRTVKEDYGFLIHK